MLIVAIEFPADLFGGRGRFDRSFDPFFLSDVSTSEPDVHSRYPVAGQFVHPIPDVFLRSRRPVKHGPAGSTDDGAVGRDSVEADHPDCSTHSKDQLPIVIVEVDPDSAGVNSEQIGGDGGNESFQGSGGYPGSTARSVRWVE